jgi:putative copper export protein
VPLMGLYGVWVWSLCRRLQPSNETLSGRRVSTQVHASAVLLLLMTLVFVFGALLWASSVLPS